MDISFLRLQARHDLNQPISATEVPNAPIPRAGALIQSGSKPTSLFERILTVIKDSVNSRIAAGKIRRSLIPVINAAVTRESVEITHIHVNALRIALASVSSVQNGADDVLYETVSLSMRKLPRREKHRLLETLQELPAAAENNDIAKLCSVAKKVIIQSIPREAELFALKAMKEFAQKDFNSFAIRNASNCLGAHLYALHPINLYVDPEFQLGKPEKAKVAIPSAIPGDAVALPTSKATKKTYPGTTQRQMSYIASSKESIVRKWFAAESKSSQIRVLANLKKIAEKEATGPDAQRLNAFCKYMETVLS